MNDAQRETPGENKRDATMKLMIHTIQVGDELTMIGPDGQRSERFVLGDLPALRCDHVWLYRADDAPIVVERAYGLDATFMLHTRHGVEGAGTR